jgi:L-ascorbate metabolism protein UlaG (beta-lactamase superfamily)
MEASPAARIVVPAPIVDLALGLGIPAERVIAARAGIAMDFGSFTIHPVRAKHGVHVDDAYSFGEKLSGGEARFLGYVLESAGVRIFHAGDSLVYEGMAERLKELRVDVALLPINGRDYYRESQDIVGNMDPREALELAARAGVDIVVPMHYEMFTENLGYAAHLVEVATRFFPGISIALLTKERPFIYSSLGFPKSELEFR